MYSLKSSLCLARAGRDPGSVPGWTHFLSRAKRSDHDLQGHPESEEGQSWPRPVLKAFDKEPPGLVSSASFAPRLAIPGVSHPPWLNRGICTWKRCQLVL